MACFEANRVSFFFIQIICAKCLETRLITHFFLPVMLVALFFFLLNQNISYTNFDECFIQDGITHVLQTLKSYPSNVR